MKKENLLLAALLLLEFGTWNLGLGTCPAQWSTNPAVNNAICTAANNQQSPPLASGSKANDTVFNKLHTVFVKNQGQYQDQAGELLFYSWFPQGISIYKDRINIYGTDVKIKKRVGNRQLAVGKEEEIYPSESEKICLHPFIEGTDLQQGIFNYFGNNQSISNIPSYGEVVYKNIYPYIDLILAGREQGKVEFIWSIYTGGNVNDIYLEIKGAKIKKTDAGEILVTPRKKNHPSFTLRNIYAYQEDKDGKKKQVEVQYVISSPLSIPLIKGGKGDFGEGRGLRFLASSYDKTKTLTIDPVVTAIIASSGTDYAYALAIDGIGGNVFVTGFTDNYSNFAPSRTVFGTTGGTDAFVTKLDNALISHLATAIITGPSTDDSQDIVIDGAGGNVFMAGFAGNPGTFAPSRTVFGAIGGAGAFVTKLDNALSSHLATAIITSSGSEGAYALAIDGVGGNVFVAGYTGNQGTFAPSRTLFGTTGGFYDSFVTKLDNALTSHLATAIIAGSDNDYVYDLAIDGAGGNVFVAGEADAAGTFAPSRTIFGTTGLEGAFVTRLDNTLTTHLATAIITGSSGDYAYALAIDGTGGNVFVAGLTLVSSNFAPSRTVFGTTGGRDAFVTKLNNALTSHLATAILTGLGNDEARGLAIDGAGGNVFAAGYTIVSSNFAPYRTFFGTAGGTDAYVTKLDNALTSHLATAIIRSSGTDFPFDLAIDGAGGNVFVAGYTTISSDFAPSRTVFGTTGTYDAFVTSLDNNLVLPIELLYFTAECILKTG